MLTHQEHLFEYDAMQTADLGPNLCYHPVDPILTI